MKQSEIQKLRNENSQAEFAVKVMRYVYGRPDKTTVVKSGIEDLTAGRAYLTAHATAEFPRVDVPTSAVLGLWDDYSFNEAHAEAIHMDQRRTDTLRYEAEQAARDARIDAVLPAFEGLMVQPEGITNREHDPVDFGERIADMMKRGRSLSITLRIEDLEAIAERIAALSRQVLDVGSGWGGSPVVDNGEPTVDPLDAVRAKLEEMRLYDDTRDASDAGYMAARDELAEFIEGLS